MFVLSAERYMLILNGVVIADLNRAISLMLAHAHCMFYCFHHACGWHRVTPEILIKLKIGFLHLEV